MDETTSYSCTIIYYPTAPSVSYLIPRPSLDLPVFIMKDRERAAQLISFILTLQCAIVPSLARQPYEGGIVAERDGQVPRGGGSRNYIADKGSFVRAIANFICERGFWL